MDYKSFVHRQLLVDELERRRRTNQRYSLRAFARFLDMDASGLSRILAGKQEVSLSLSLKIMKRLTLTNEQCRVFANSVAEERKERALSILSKGIDVNNTDQHCV